MARAVPLGFARLLVPAFVALVALLGCGGGSDTGMPDMTAALRVPEIGAVPPLPAWPDDPPTADKIALGTAMFFDPRLSGSGHSNCDGCHGHLTAFQDNLIFAIPDRSYPRDRPQLTRNTPSFYNVVYAPVFRWDGSHTDLVDVMPFPFSEPNMNLGSDVPSAQKMLRQRLTVDVPAYRPLFEKAYGADLTKLDEKAVWRLSGRALAAFVRLAVSRDAPFDRWNAGDDAAMSAAAVRGVGWFRNEGRCVSCHVGPLLSDFQYHNLSTSLPDLDGRRTDEGRFLVSGVPADRGAFLTPTLRGAYDTPPYFHDGSGVGLRAVIKHLTSAAVLADPNHDRLVDPPPSLTSDQIDDVVEFLAALRGAPVELVEPPRP